MAQGGRHGSKRRGDSGYRGAGSGRQSARPRGLFTDATWHCDCSPRLPAEHFKVKKEGKNQGRWFYTCQQQQPKRCGFFLWDEDAKPREEAAVLSNSRTEPEATKNTKQHKRVVGKEDDLGSGKGLFANQESHKAANDEETDSPTPSPIQKSQSSVTIGTKRSAQSAQLDDNTQDEFWSLSDANNEDLMSLADAAVPQTPHKAQKIGVYATPVTTGKRKLPWLAELDTPVTGNANLNDVTTPTKPPADNHGQPTIDVAQPDVTIISEGPATHVTSAADSRQHHSRHRDAFIDPADPSRSLTREVLAELSTVTVPSEVLLKVRSILAKHDLKAQGVAKGRDITRLAVKAKDAKIAELFAKISSLEAERELERAVIRKLTSERKQLGSS